MQLRQLGLDGLGYACRFAVSGRTHRGADHPGRHVALDAGHLCGDDLDDLDDLHRAAAGGPPVLADISMTSVPADVIVPTTPASLDASTNPINGRRGGPRPSAGEIDCVTGTTATCLTGILDTLGFDVTSGPADDRDRRRQRATAVIQLDAGLPVTGQPDPAVLQYVGMAAGVPWRSRRARRARSGPRRRDGRSSPSATATDRGRCSSSARPTVTRRVACESCYGHSRSRCPRGSRCGSSPR